MHYMHWCIGIFEILIICFYLFYYPYLLQELNPPIWRTFKVSSAVNLELLHDKIIAPIMGWTRNYHTYYFMPVGSNCNNEEGSGDGGGGVNEPVMDGRVQTTRRGDSNQFDVLVQGDDYRGGTNNQHRIHYLQADTTSSDAMHAHKIVDEEYQRRPENATIGDLLKRVGDRCVYNSDLGDCFYHCLEVEQVVPIEESNGAVVIYDGAMRCPSDDGDGSAWHQTNILDLLLKCREDPYDNITARKLSANCFEKRSGLNTQGPFRPEEFDINERRMALAQALESRNSTRNFVKSFNFGKVTPIGPGIGQRQVEVKKMDDRAECGYMTFHETLNIKPDPVESTLCSNCGTPTDLKACSRCMSSFYW